MSLNPEAYIQWVFIDVLMFLSLEYSCSKNMQAWHLFHLIQNQPPPQPPFIEAKGFQSWFTSNEWIECLTWNGFMPTEKSCMFVQIGRIITNGACPLFLVSSCSCSAGILK